MPAPAGVFVSAGDTMPTMKKLAVLLFALLGFAAAAAAQEYSDDPYDFILAKLAADDGRYEEALARLDKLVQKNPDNAVLRFERAMVMLDASRNDAAEAELRKVVQLQPNFYDAERILGRLLLDRAGSDRAKIDDALAHLQAAFNGHPDDMVTGMAIAQIYLGTGRNAEAEKVLGTMLERAPDNRLVNFTYAQVLTKLGRGDESRKYLERAVEVDPTFGQAIMQLIDIDQKAGEFGRAAEVLQPLLNEDPNNLDLQRQQALYFLRAGRAEKARVAFGMVVDADPKDARSQYYLAEALTDLEQYEQADKIYRKLLEKTPDDTDLLASYGLSQIGQAKFGVKNTIGAAEAFVQAEQYPEAIALLRDAVRTKPDEIDLQFELGSVYERSGDKAAAEKQFLTLLAQHPEHAQTLNYLGYMW